MREILFRGKRKYNNEWVYGFFTGYFADDPIIKNDNDNYIVIEETIDQFTGLFDKNKKRIFEHDIIKSDYGYICVVDWNEMDWYSVYRSHNSSILTVIGNVFDNFELLENNRATS